MAACAIVLAASAILAGASPAMAESPPSFLLKWGSWGSGNGQFRLPGDVATDSSGNVYVADSGNDRIQKFTSSGVFLAAWGGNGTGAGQFVGPDAVATDSSGNVYVADTQNSRVQKFNSGGAFLAAWGWDVVVGGGTGFEICTPPATCKAGNYSGAGDGQFNWPEGIATDSSSNVYVADANHRRVQKFTSAGTFLTKWGTVGSGDGQFESPSGVAVDFNGNVYVADGLINHRVQKFTSAGTFLTKWGSWGPADGQFEWASDIATDSSGNVYVADPGNYRIQKFTSTGTLLTKWTGFGSPGELSWPEGVATDSSGNVYVVDSIKDSVLKFGPAPAFSIDATARDFGGQSIAAGPTAGQSFTVTNAGDADLVFGAVDLTGGDADQFQITANGCASQTLVPSGSCTVTAVFDPATAGLKQTNLRFNHNASGNPTDVALQGTGTDPNASAGPEVIGAKRKTTVGKGAKFSVEVTCPAGRTEACQGKLSANAKASKKKKKKVRAQAKGKTVVVSSARYSVSPGAKAKVRMKLNKAGSRMLRTSRPRNKLPVTLTATNSVAGNPAIASTKTVLALKGKRTKGK